MRVSVPLIVQRPVGTHSLPDKVVLDVGTQYGQLLRPVHLDRQGNFDFHGKLRGALFLHLLDAFPQGCTVLVACRRFRRQHGFSVDYPSFVGVVVHDAGFLVQQFCSRPICNSCDDGSACAAADDLCAAMVDSHRLSPCSDSADTVRCPFPLGERTICIRSVHISAPLRGVKKILTRSS